jgi:hypothetical protein
MVAASAALNVRRAKDLREVQVISGAFSGWFVILSKDGR